MDENGSGIERSLGRVESALRGIDQWCKHHDGIDEKRFDSQDKRLAALEGLADMVEGHGTALLDIEQRVSLSEKKWVSEDAKRERDRMWLRWILTLLTALTADHFTGSKIAELVAHLIK